MVARGVSELTIDTTWRHYDDGRHRMDSWELRRAHAGFVSRLIRGRLEDSSSKRGASRYAARPIGLARC